jgi:hypothetical protein
VAPVNRPHISGVGRSRNGPAIPRKHEH